MRFFVSREKGFTLIEIVVVIAVIGILASVVLANLHEGRLKADDAQRISDLQQVQLALRLYKDAHSSETNVYPEYDAGAEIATLTGVGGVLAKYFPTAIQDPMNTGEYKYYYDSDFTCNGNSEKVIYAETMALSASSNWSTTCSESAPGTNTYIIILR